jgi:hypothetical protein
MTVARMSTTAMVLVSQLARFDGSIEITFDRPSL